MLGNYDTFSIYIHFFIVRLLLSVYLYCTEMELNDMFTCSGVSVARCLPLIRIALLFHQHRD